MVLVERAALREKQHLGAEQADALRAVGVRAAAAPRGTRRWRAARPRARRSVSVGAPAASVASTARRANCSARCRARSSVWGVGATVTVPGEAVQHDRVADGDAARQPVQAHDGRDAQRARHDRDVARRAAVVQHDAQHASAAEHQDVGRGEVLGDHDRAGLDVRQRAPALEVAEHAVLDVQKVGRGLAERGQRRRPQALPVRVEHALHGPAGADAAGRRVVAADARHDGVVEGRVAQDERLRVEDAARRVAQLFARDGRHAGDLALAARDRPPRSAPARPRPRRPRSARARRRSRRRRRRTPARSRRPAPRRCRPRRLRRRCREQTARRVRSWGSASGQVARAERPGRRFCQARDYAAGASAGSASEDLVEAALEERLDRVGGLGLVGPVEEQFERRVLLGGERHHADDALAVDLVAVLADKELGREPRRLAHDHRRRPGVDAGLVSDRDLASEHRQRGSGRGR